MNILFVTNNLPYPPTDGWKIRVWAFIRYLSAQHRVSIASFMRTTEDPRAVEMLQAHGVDVSVVPRHPRYSALNLVRGLFGRTAFSVLNYRDNRMQALIRRLLAAGRFEIVQAESLQMAQYCIGAPAMTVLDLHNIESLLMKRYAECVTNPLKRAYADITWRKLWRYETTTYGRFDECLACSEEDRTIALQQAPATRVTIVPNGVDLQLGVSINEPHRISAGKIVFVGRMDYHANVDGIVWFCREVLPRLRAVRPDVSLQIVGGNPSLEVRRLAQPGVVDVLGFVEEIGPFLREAAIVIVPLRVGGGTRLKILEALGLGKAVVSTRVGAEGIAITHGSNILIADEAGQFAESVLALLADPGWAHRLGLAGRRLVEQQYNWEAIVARLEELYRARLATRHTAGGPCKTQAEAVAG
jgi:sugar transferase (PEP-CTERM/EpsH1 system associated)